VLGNARVVEKGLSDQHFEIVFEIVHPLLGRAFGYSGTFTIAGGDYPRHTWDLRPGARPSRPMAALSRKAAQSLLGLAAQVARSLCDRET